MNDMSVNIPILNDIQMSAFNTIEHTHSNVLILGQAGTGKSTFINYVKAVSNKRVICACPTAVSALNVSGQTIHSLFQIQPRDFIMPELLKLKAKPRNILNAADVLIIDEISMVAPDLLDAIDILARLARHNNDPFGGLQIVAIGDLFQLPPVITNDAKDYYVQTYEHANAYFFDSNVYKRAQFLRYDFDFVYRQSDKKLLENLKRLRRNDLSALDFFNCCKIDDVFKRENAVIITPFRSVAEKINFDKLAQIEYGDKWYNGSMGIVRNLNAREIQVELLNLKHDIVNVKPEKWSKIEYIRDENDRLIENEVGSFKQFPLNLGYAMTIHKAQGKTLDAVTVDISRGAFTHGQTYVALSRTRKSSDIHVLTPLKPQDVIFDNRVLEFVDLNLFA